MLVFFLLQEANYDKPYSNPSDILPLLCDAMSPVVPSVDITPPSPTRTSAPSGGRPSDPITPPKPSGTTATSLHVQDTPLVIKQSGTTPHTSLTDPNAELRDRRMANEVKGHFVGPVLADDFFEYLPAAKEEFIFDAEKAKTAKMHEELIRQAAKKNENEMYGPLKAMIEDILGPMLKFCKFSIALMSSKVLTNFFGSDVKPDFVLHRGDLKKKKGEKFQLHNVEMMIEVKHEKCLDPFVDDNEDQVEGTTDLSEHTLGQSGVYATCHESIQARHIVFQVLIIEDYARLLRWDRSGAIVTCKIPLSNPKFFEFFWRFCHLDAEDRGWDTTMTPTSQDDLIDAKPALDAAEKELGIEGDTQYYSKISLGKGTYIAHRIFSGTQSPFGRGTRGYAAYNLTTKEVVFLKSTWRVVGDGRMPEHEIYNVLHASEVEHIPTVVEYAEVSNHVTKTQDTPKSWRRNNVKNLRKFQHYFIMFKELCRKLENFQSRKQLLTVFSHAANAHQQALDKATILHRDISAGNILITREGNGLLGDWDMAKYLRDIKNSGPQPERTGTFQFLSARFVSDQYDFGPHDRKDDIESFFHTLQWIVLRFVYHGMHPDALGGTLYRIFDAIDKGENGIAVCQGRLHSIQNSIWAKYKNLDHVLRDLFEVLRKTINSRYIPAEDMDRAEERYTIYRELQKQLSSDPAQLNSNEIKYLRELATPAILYEDLGRANWFWQCLRDAAARYRQDDPGEASTLQKYTPVSTHGSKKTAKSENKISTLDYYDGPVSKRPKLDIGYPAHYSVNSGEASSANDSNDDKPRTRKTPYGRRPFEQMEEARA